MSTMLEFNLNYESGINIILSHGDMDGITSAAILADAMRLGERNYIVLVDLDPTPKKTEAMYLEAQEIIKERTGGYMGGALVYVADRACMSKEFVREHKKQISVINFIDHHKTNLDTAVQDKLEMLQMVVFNLDDITYFPEYSGATMSLKTAETMLDVYEWSYDEIITFENKWRTFVEAVAYWDTFSWKKGEPNSQEVLLAQAIGKTDKVLPVQMIYDKMMNTEEEFTVLENMQQLIFIAGTMYDYQFDAEYNKAVSNVTVLEDKIAFIKDIDGKFISLVADKMFEEFDYDIVFGVSNKGLCSIRVSQTCEINAGEVAKKFGNIFGFNGGGHPKAAGFKIAEVEEVDRASEFVSELMIYAKGIFKVVEE